MTSRSTTLFDVDPKGLAKLLEGRGKGFAVVELVANAWDTHATRVEVTLTPVERAPYAELSVVDDDPDGFADLRHAYTLFAESTRKADPTQRGRFNLGEKLVIALCESCVIQSTKGSIRFDHDGRHHQLAALKRGSAFAGRIRMTRAEYDETLTLLHRLIVPADVTFIVNGVEVPHRQPIAKFTVTLPTVLADDDGNLRPTERQTTVRVYEPHGTPSLYELGVPVVDTGDAYDVDIAQKVPLNMDRDNVTPSYLRKVRTAVLNQMHGAITPEQAKASWVAAALEDPNVDDEAVRSVVTARFGRRNVISDPSDPEGTKRAMAEGYTVIPPGAFNRQQWDAIRSSGASRPAGQVTPSLAKRLADSDGPAMRMLDPDAWSPQVRAVADYARRLGLLVLGYEPRIEVGNDPMFPAAATFGARTLMLNRGRLGERWFARIGEETDALLLHEFAHDRVSDHLSSGFADEIARLAAKLVRILLTDQEALSPVRSALAVTS